MTREPPDNQLAFELPGLSGRKIEANFRGGDVSSDGGLVMLGQVDRWLGLSKGLAQRLPERRDARASSRHRRIWCWILAVPTIGCTACKRDGIFMVITMTFAFYPFTSSAASGSW